MRVKKFLKTLTVLTLASSVWAASTSFNVDPAHSLIQFRIQHLGIAKVTGRFDKFESTFKFDDKSSTVTAIDVKIQATSINTNDVDRDKHLRSKDFFNVEKFPILEFKADKIELKVGKSIALKGNLTIIGNSKPVTLDVEYKGSVVDPWGNNRHVFSATGKINRKDFGITWNKKLEKAGAVGAMASGFVLGEEVELLIEGEALASK
jgi:polyisoprenoid-binding protein YceI